MRIKSILFITILFVSVNIFSQNNLNDYKYIIVPEQYSFFKTPNKYRLNELGKFLFNKYGFTAFLTNENFPDDLKNNSCLALRTEVEKQSSLFTTKLKIILKDCKGETVFVSRIGSTREKDLTKAYNLSLRDAFKSFENVNYKYVPKENEVNKSDVIVAGNNTNEEEVKRLQGEVKALEEAKIAAEKQKIADTEKAEVIRKEREREIKLKKDAETLQEQRDRKIALEKETVKKAKDTIEEHNNETVLYAQPVDNGYQLVDSTPKVVMILIQTGRKDTFIVKDQNASVYKEDGVWFISKTENGKPITKKINIKF